MNNEDDYNVYYYDPNAVVASVQSPDNSATKNTYESVFTNLNKTLDPWEVRLTPNSFLSKNHKKHGS